MVAGREVVVTRQTPPLAFRATEGVVAGQRGGSGRSNPSARVSSDGGGGGRQGGGRVSELAEINLPRHGLMALSRL